MICGLHAHILTPMKHTAAYIEEEIYDYYQGKNRNTFDVHQTAASII